MTAIEIIKQKHDKYELLGDLHYLIGLDDDDTQICEINSDISYCEKCAIEESGILNKKLKEIGLQAFKKEYGIEYIEDLYEIGYTEEYSPERDCFEACETCCIELDCGVLFTFSQEIDYWIGEIEDGRLDLSDMSEQNAYRLYTCLTSKDALKKHPKQVSILKELILLKNGEGNI